MQGYDALREGAAWLDLAGRGHVVVTGEDHVRLLHAMTTNHIQQLAPGQGCYAFLLNPQGRIQADVNVLAFNGHMVLDTEAETAGRVVSHLDHYIIADDVTLEDRTGVTAVIAVEGPRAAEALAAAGAPLPDAPYAHVGWNDWTVCRLSATGQPGFRIFASMEDKKAVVARIEAGGIPAADAEAARVVRLENGKPRYGEDIFDTSLVHDTRQLHAVHFNKGCYTGQEIVERVRSRGMVHRLLVALHIASTQPPPAATDVTAEGAQAGKITSAAYSPALGKVAALAYLKREFTNPGTEVECAGAPAEVVNPWTE